MKPTPSEYLILIILAVFGLTLWVFQFPLSYSFAEIATDMRWATLLLVVQICAIPVSIGVTRTVLRHLSFLKGFVSNAPAEVPVASIRLALGHEWGAFKKGLTLLRDWLPLFVFIWTYWAAGTLFIGALLFPLRDADLARWDLFLFGAHYSVLAQKFYSAPLTAVMDFCYFMHVVIIPLFLGLCYIRGEVVIFRRAIFFLLLAGFLGDVGFVLFPAYGPFYYLRDLYTQDLLRHPFVTSFIDLTRSAHDAFPSLHVAISSGLLYYQYRYVKWLFWLLLPFAVGNWLSTIYLRYHYTVDLLAGFLIAAAAVMITELTFNAWEKKRRGDSPEKAKFLSP